MNNIEILKKILLSNNIKEKENIIFDIIPELIYEKGFEQKSVWHSYDVWNHTLVAVENCDNNFDDRLILLLHDIGKPFSYQDAADTRHFKGHAQKSALMAKPILEGLGYEKEKLREIISIIQDHATKINKKDINKENIDYYKRLLKIQMCDGMAYEEKHAKMIYKDLEDTKNYINNL